MYYLKMDMFSLGLKNKEIKVTLKKLKANPNSRAFVIEALEKEFNNNEHRINIIKEMVGEEILKTWRTEFKEFMIEKGYEKKPVTTE